MAELYVEVLRNSFLPPLFCWILMKLSRNDQCARGCEVTQQILLNPLDSKGNYSATSNNMKLVHWPLMGGLLHLVQRGGALAASQSPPQCTKCNSPPMNDQCTNHCIAI